MVGGTLDATAGVIFYYIFLGLNPLQVLQYIASGVYGCSVIGGSFAYVLLGLVLHYLISFVAARLYFAAYPKINLLSKFPILPSLLFDLAIWLFMNLSVLSCSNIPKGIINEILRIIEIIYHSFLVGLPMALVIRNNYANKQI